MIFVSTKAGFVETDTLQQLLLKDHIFEDEVKGGVNCIAPACLKASLEQSLEALNLETVSSSSDWVTPFSVRAQKRKHSGHRSPSESHGGRALFAYASAESKPDLRSLQGTRVRRLLGA